MALKTAQCKNSIQIPYFLIFNAPLHAPLLLFIPSEAAVEADLMYMLQPSRMYIGDNINVFRHGK